MNILQDFKQRGLIYQVSNEKALEKILQEKKIVLYGGFDPTADSLHIGNLLLIITLKRFEKFGHKPILLIGGGTGLIGDPSGKKQERSLNRKEVVVYYSNCLKKQLGRFFDFKNKKAILENNSRWIAKLRLVDFLRDIGRHFSVGYMLAKESVKERINTTGISFTEFSYMVLQAYDFLNLYKKYNCVLQIGGSDQWGNITAGIELIRRLEGKEAFGLTHPLLTTKEGRKFGKTEKGAVWLDAKKTSPYHFYQFWINVPDEDVIKLLKFYTFLSGKEISELEKEVKENPQKREAQKVLAKELTIFVHGEKEYRKAERTSQILFRGDIEKLKKEDIEDVFSNVPNFKIEKGREINLIDLLLKGGICGSKREARDLIKNKGIYVNGEVINRENVFFSYQKALYGKYLVIRKGKKNYYLGIFEKNE